MVPAQNGARAEPDAFTAAIRAPLQPRAQRRRRVRRFKWSTFSRCGSSTLVTCSALRCAGRVPSASLARPDRDPLLVLAASYSTSVSTILKRTASSISWPSGRRVRRRNAATRVHERFRVARTRDLFLAAPRPPSADSDAWWLCSQTLVPPNLDVACRCSQSWAGVRRSCTSRR